MQQSGFAIGRTTPRAKVFLDGQMVARASDGGFFYLGFDRDAGPHARVRIDARGADLTRQLQIDRAEYDVQRIKGLRRVYQGQASPELEARIAEESRRKAAAFASVTDRDDFRTGFSAPLRDFRVTARFGGQRIVDGRPRPPHYGIDLAAPTGTPVTAPAGGLVVLADPRMLYEGGIVMIDHGQGVVSAYLHLSSVDVAGGQSLARGQRIGAVGSTGRATGPHLCWRLKWRGRHMNPMLMVGVPGPA
ncbi:M23 family metallopeptidase [Phenylobacterium sp. NIBR 498073]|uniref:M23 family metallopeptidase n=1 Tax=Phenylobacterium sp. NIBR 498073 TaxID=3015177 RepID=UPI0022B4DBEF|nr:M23 family metallopeptidase [Phenylobacterium sp. NIBR 498073]WGU41016.1 M23 family metallopeptidase [Phenylobacterium sp. NIBR 498073]